jgi:hypothetical protein
MLSPELYPVQRSLNLFLQLQQELHEFLNDYYGNSPEKTEPAFSFYCSGQTYRTDEFHLGLRRTRKPLEKPSGFKQGEYFG